MVIEYVDSMASEAGESPKELLEAATEKARLNVISAKGALERVEKDLERMSRERLLPTDKILEKVARYEAHLSRGLYKALHELEALQTRRLVHIQNRSRVRRYSGNHETSDLRPFNFGHRKRAVGKRPTLQGRFRHAPSPDHPRQQQGRTRLDNSPLIGMRLPDSARRYPRLQ